MKTLTILGATGSIGMNTLDVVRHQPGRFRVRALTTHRNIDLVLRLAKEFSPGHIVVTDDEKAREIRKRNIPSGTTVLSGREGLIVAATDTKADLIVSSLVGAAGLEPTLAAIKKGLRVALANKEVLVAAGEYIHANFRRELRENIVPIDSEHSAIHQSLRGEKMSCLEKIILTASGGPFLRVPRNRFPRITPAQALRHPNWVMGSKITIDSATMMNKGLEVIEARWLFDVGPERIEVLIHPESIIHSMVQFCDGSIIGQMNVADMRIPIQYALFYPDRMPNRFPRVDFPKVRSFRFLRPDVKKFPLIATAFRALEKGNIFPAAMNAANEVAVESFLTGKISFDKIPVLVEDIMLASRPAEKLGLGEILKADRAARSEARQWVQKNRS
jgi:1-deoxy-D-xylulose-5-phosphate reductoisomerase